MSDLSSPVASRLPRTRAVDSRALVGLVLLLVSVVAGVRVVGGADRTSPVWAMTRSLPAGTRLNAADLTAVRVRLTGPGARRYLDAAGSSPVGQVLARDVGEGELLPVAALVPDDAASPLRLVTVPVAREHAVGGQLKRGDRVDVLATFRTSGQGSVTRVVLQAVPVLDVVHDAGSFGSNADFAVVLGVAPEHALAITSAVQSAELDLLKVVAEGDPGRLTDGEVRAGPDPA